MELEELGVCDTVAAVRERRVTIREIAEALVRRHDEIDPSLRAVSHFNGERLVETAAAMDARLASGKSPDLGPLTGVAIGIKDIYDCEGLPTSDGIRGRKPRVATRTARCLRRLLKAGALIYGKTASTDRAYLDPADTRNPWHLDHTPGGSSSGSAAGVAARLFPAAIGSQTAGSVIRPAAYCGIVGMTLTRGRVRLDRGVLPLAPRFDTPGLMARSVADIELLTAAWCGDDKHGPQVQDTPQPFLDRPYFFGFARRGFMEKTEDEAAHHTIHAARELSEKGAIVHVLGLPESFDRLVERHRSIFAYEANLVHRVGYRNDPESFGPKLSELIEDGFEVTDAEYVEALEWLEQFRRDMLVRVDEVDAIILPAATGPAPLGLDSTGDAACNAPWTAIGFPCITVPSGLHSNGLPLGLQIVGRPNGERFLLQAARFCMQVLDFGCPTPGALAAGGGGAARRG